MKPPSEFKCWQCEAELEKEYENVDGVSLCLECALELRLAKLKAMALEEESE